MKMSDYARRKLIDRVLAIAEANNCVVTREKADEVCDVLRNELGDLHPYATDEQILTTMLVLGLQPA